MEHSMSESGNNVSKQTLFISIGVSLLLGFLVGIVYSDRSPQPGGQLAQQQQGQPQAPPQSQFAQALPSLQLAVQQNPNNADIWTQLGHAYFDTNQPAKAIEAYTKALAIVPGNPSTLTDLGVMYRRNDQPEKALESFDKAITIQPGFEQALFNKGIVYSNDLRDPESAIQAWKELLIVNPGATGPGGIPIAQMIKDISK